MIPHFTRQCRTKHIFMVFHMNIIPITKSDDMVFMVPATASYPKKNCRIIRKRPCGYKNYCLPPWKWFQYYCGKGGKSIDTTMGLTPLAGVIMGTRAGDIDPAIIEFLGNKTKKSIEEINTILNKESGVYGLSGVSSDFRDLAKGMEEGNDRCRLALDVFCYGVKKYIGAYAAAMNGVDAIAFTAGIGENNPYVRGLATEGLEYMGVSIDKEANEVKGEEKLISAADSKVKVFVVPTNEELAIARETVALVK